MTKYYQPKMYWGFRVWGIVFSLLLSVGLISVLMRIITNWHISISIEDITLVFALFFGYFIVILMMHVFPNVGVNESEIIVQFLWTKIQIPWIEIESLDEIKFLTDKIWLVKTDKTPVFFSIYSLVYGMGFKQGFLIFERTKNVEELINIIEKNME